MTFRKIIKNVPKIIIYLNRAKEKNIKLINQWEVQLYYLVCELTTKKKKGCLYRKGFWKWGMIWLALFLLFYQYIALIKYLNFKKKKKQKTKNKATNRSRTAKTTTKSIHRVSHLQGLETAENSGTQMISDEKARDTSSFRWIDWVWWQQHTQIFLRKCLKRRQATVAKSRTPIPEMEFLCECVFFVQWLSHMQLSGTPWTGACQTLLLCPWESPGKNTAVGCHFLLRGIFPT